MNIFVTLIVHQVKSDCNIVYFDLETTGLIYSGSMSDITQISAIYSEKEYDKYVFPRSVRSNMYDIYCYHQFLDGSQ